MEARSKLTKSQRMRSEQRLWAFRRRTPPFCLKSLCLKIYWPKIRNGYNDGTKICPVKTTDQVSQFCNTKLSIYKTTIHKYTSLIIYVFVAWYLVKPGDKFTLPYLTLHYTTYTGQFVYSSHTKYIDDKQSLFIED